MRELTQLHYAAFHMPEWTLRPNAERIRNNTSLQVEIATHAHKLLHFMTSPVPVPSRETLTFVAERLPEDLDIITGIDKYCFLVEASNRHPRAKDVDRALGELSIHAMREQIPWIVDGLPEQQRRYFI